MEQQLRYGYEFSLPVTVCVFTAWMVLWWGGGDEE